MKVGELLALLGAADPDIEVQICVVDKYYDVDTEFCGTGPGDADQPTFFIEADESTECQYDIADDAEATV